MSLLFNPWFCVQMLGRQSRSDHFGRLRVVDYDLIKNEAGKESINQPAIWGY
jgi:hypothetical protein